ncbi:MAG TPA: tetratricopeptide repeat protein, partial [Pirellulales bacterium]|nr:tetratricopeptide repeat protein [Pirellulales bacterium]
MLWALGGGALWLTILVICASRQTTHWRDSESIWRHAVANAPSAKAHLSLADALDKQGNQAEAMEQYRAALALTLVPASAPTSDLIRRDVYTRMGDLHAKQRRADEAIGDYRRALAINPESFVIHNNLGEILATRGNLDEATAEYRQAIKYAPQIAACVVNLGLVYWRQGKLADAIACYEQARALDPDVPLARDALGHSRAENERLGPVEVGCRRAVALDPDSAPARFKLAETLAGLSQFSEAAARYEQVLKFMQSEAFQEAHPGSHEVTDRAVQ